MRWLKNLGWRTMEQRRADARLCLFYKVVHGLVAVPLPDYIRYCHCMTIRQVSTSTYYYKYPFLPLAIVQWTALPEYVACLQSIEVFKNAVCKLQHTRPEIPTELFYLILANLNYFNLSSPLMLLNLSLPFLFDFLE